jgi:hypothetical protein
MVFVVLLPLLFVWLASTWISNLQPQYRSGFYGSAELARQPSIAASEALGYVLAQYQKAGVLYHAQNPAFVGVIPAAALAGDLPAVMSARFGWQGQVVVAGGLTYVVTSMTAVLAAPYDGQAMARGALRGFEGVIAGVSDGANVVVGIPRSNGGSPFFQAINNVVPLPAPLATPVPAGTPVAFVKV